MNAARLTDTHYAYTEANHVRRVEKRTTALGAEGEQLEVTETWLPAAPNEYARGRLKMKQSASGVQAAECGGMHREHGAAEACCALRRERGSFLVSLP